MRPTRHPLPLRPSALLAGVLALTGCGGGHVSTHRADPPGPPVYQEAEPNDSPFGADWFGGLHDHEHFFIEGHVDAFGPDVYDHFEFVADEPIGVEFWLDGWTPGADVDLCVIDPEDGDVLACYDSPYGSESGYFTIDWPGKRFVLLVETFVHDTGYTLEIHTTQHLAPPGGGGGESGDGAPTAQQPTSGPDAGPGISFPYGRPRTEKEEHAPDAPPRDGWPSDREMARRQELEG